MALCLLNMEQGLKVTVSIEPPMRGSVKRCIVLVSLRCETRS